MSPPTGEREGARVTDWEKVANAIAGKLYSLVRGTEIVDEVFAIAREHTRPAAPAQPGEGEPSADEAWDMLRALVNACGWMGPASAPVTLDQQFTRARALLERRGGKGLFGEGGRG